MTPDDRSSTSLSTTSGESQPIVKRRRTETAAHSKTVGTTRSSAGPQTSSSDNGPGLEIVRIQKQQGSVPSYENHETQLQSFKPLRTIVTVKCGNRLSVDYRIDLALICAESEQLSRLFMQAQDLYEQHSMAKVLRKEARRFYSLLMSRGILKMDNSRDKAMEIIMHAMQSFPVVQYQTIMKAKIIAIVDIYFQDYEMSLLPPAKAKKLDRSTYPKEDVSKRLEQMKTEAFFAVIERLNSFMQRLKDEESGLLVKDPLKAAAYRQILLPDTDPLAVEVVLRWLHRDALRRMNIDQLLRVYIVADRLGITRLAAECMDLFSSSVCHAIGKAKSQGITLTDLLQRRQTTADKGVTTEDLSDENVVGEVFMFTLQSSDPPAELQNLVVNAIVDSEDDEVCETLLSIMSSDMRGKLAMATMRKVKFNSMTARKIEHGSTQDHASPAGGVKYRESPASSRHSEHSSIKSEASVFKYDWNSATRIASNEMRRKVQYGEQADGHEDD